MEIFILVLKQMLTMMTLIVIGFALRKSNILPDDTDKALSKLGTFVFIPALLFTTQLNKCTIETFTENANLILIGACVILVSIFSAIFLSKLFIRNANGDEKLLYQRNIYKYAMAFANHGYMGTYIVLGVWGEAMLFKYTIFKFSLDVLCIAWGLYVLIPKGKNEGLGHSLKRTFTSPPIIALILGMICGIFGLKKYFPEFLLTSITDASKCMCPCLMLLAGVVCGGYDIKKLFKNKKVYIVSLLRLIVLPAVFLLALKLLGAGTEIQIFTLVAFASPIGMNTIVYPSAYGGDPKIGASMTLISTIFSVVTIPLMYYFLIYLF